jgi:hypothetical protein
VTFIFCVSARIGAGDRVVSVNQPDSVDPSCLSGAAGGALGGATADAKFVAFWIGQDHPTTSVRTAPVGQQSSPESQGALDLTVAICGRWPQIEMNPIFGGLTLRDAQEQETRLAWTFQNEDGVVSRQVTRPDLALKKARPKSGEPVRVHSVEGDLVNLEEW